MDEFWFRTKSLGVDVMWFRSNVPVVEVEYQYILDRFSSASELAKDE